MLTAADQCLQDHCWHSQTLGCHQLLHLQQTGHQEQHQAQLTGVPQEQLSQQMAEQQAVELTTRILQSMCHVFVSVALDIKQKCAQIATSYCQMVIMMCWGQALTRQMLLRLLLLQLLLSHEGRQLVFDSLQCSAWGGSSRSFSGCNRTQQCTKSEDMVINKLRIRMSASMHSFCFCSSALCSKATRQ